MRPALLSLAAVLVLANAAPALPGLERLDARTAQEVIARSTGVVVVDVYADW